MTIGSEASLVTVKVPLNIEAALGVNEMVSGVLRPGATETGNVGDASEKYFDENEAPLIVTVLVPELLADIVTVLLLPGVTSPKSMLALPRANIEEG